jgi:chromosome partitioning protein
VGITEERRRDSSMYHILIDDELPIENCTVETGVQNLFIAPASLDLAAAEVELRSGFAAELYLRAAFERSELDFDFILIDCPPSLGLLTTNGLTAAQEVLVPVQCEYFALEGTGQLLVTLEKVRKKLNRSLELSTVVCVMYDARTNLADRVIEGVRENFGDKVCKTVIPRTVRLSEAPELGQPIIIFDSSSRGSIAYRDLAKEISGGASPRNR